MVKNIELEQLVINKLTQEQFDSIEEKNPAELYFITDAEVDGGKGAQVEEMPEATEMNAGQIVQYVGETIPDIEATAIITQTVGDSLANLKVNTKKFGKASGLTEPGSLEFYTTGSKIKFVSDELPTDNNQGLTVKIDSDKFFDWLSYYEHIVDINRVSQVLIACVVNHDSSISDWEIEVYFDNNTSSAILMSHSPELPEESGISYEVAWLDNFNIWCRAYFEIVPKAEWLIDNQVIDVNQYGITYSGTPSNGDTLKVDYIPFVGGYEKGYFYVNQAQPSDSVVAHKWNQINVQPASKSSGGIEWVTKLDLPADYPDSYRWSCHPIWTIPGGVPDGTYEFYVQSLCGANWEPERGGMQNYTVKVLVKFYTKNNMQYHFGAVSYVVDGTWTGDGNFRPIGLDIHRSFKKGDNNLYFWYEGNPFQSSLPGYMGSVVVPGIFKMSAWKNIDSGETYIPEGMLYTGSHPRYETTIEGYLNLQPLCAPVNYPSFYAHYNVDIDENRQYARIGPEYIFDDGTHSVASAQSATFDIKSKSGGTFYATIKNKNGSCVVQELESSGDLKNVQLGTGDDGYSYICFNNNDLSQVEVLFSLTGIRNTENSANIMFESWVTPSSFTPLTIERVGAPITAFNLGKTLQYTQESTDEYTKGYFYKSSGTATKTPASMEVTWQSVDGVEILIDAEKLAQAIGSYVGWDVSYVKNDLLRYNHSYVYYENEGSPYVYAGFWGDFHDSRIVECFTINGELPDKYIEFNAGNYIDSVVEVVDGKWEQINVQPASNTVQVTEIPEASEENVGKILQYIGTPTSEYDQGYFYKCTADGWVQVNVQPSSGGGGEAPSELPNLTGNEGRFLSNNGSELEWADIPTSLPAQEGHSGKYLTTDGENASWVEIELPESTDGVELPDQTGNSGKFLTTDGTNLSWAEVSSGGGTVSGDYLPLSGGTLTGPLKFENAIGFSGDITLKAENWGAYGGDRFFIENAVLVVDGVRPSTSGLVQLGACKEPENQIYPEGEFFSRVCTKALNNGTYQDDIIIPEKSGTLALIEDLPDTSTLATKEELNSKIPPHPTDDGVYTLACSVVNGVATYSWESIA